MESFATKDRSQPIVAEASRGAAEAPVPGAGHPTFLCVLAVPWANLFRPQRAARRMVSAGRLHFAITFTSCLLSLAVSIAVSVMWDDMYSYEWIPAPNPPTGPVTSTSPFAYGHPEYRYRSMVDIWRDWHRGRLWWFGPFEGLVLATLVLGTAGVAALAWLYLCRVHRIGSVWASYCRTFRAASSVLGVVALGVLFFGVYFFARKWESLTWTGSEYSDTTRLVNFVIELIEGFGIVASLALALGWLSRAVRGVEPGHLELQLPPRCEACGYDLTHQPTEGRCTECGLPFTASLTPGQKRPGSVWMRQHGVKAWLRSAWGVLWSPRRFYGALRLRDGDSTERHFARWNCALVWLLATGWTALAFTLYGLEIAFYNGTPNWRELAICIPFGLGVALATWAAQRIVGAIAATWWFARHTFPDGRWAAKIVAYESIFVWPTLIYLGLLAVSLVLSEDWLSNLFGGWVRYPFRMPVEAAAVFIAIPAYLLPALWRYRIAGRAVRWSNF